jgi:hypothetical protein
MTAPVVVDKEMGITHAEFLRVIGRALAGRPHGIAGNHIRITEDGRSLDITLGPEGERRIALMTIPVTRVRLAFNGYSHEETAAALARFDRWFQRGGG